MSYLLAWQNDIGAQCIQQNWNYFIAVTFINQSESRKNINEY